jgi:outer membrane protein TolC
VVPTPPALDAFEAPGEVLRRRPDVRAAEASLLASTARIKGAQAQLLPRIQLGGTIGIPTSGLGNLFEIVTGTLFGSVSQLIFDGGRTRARIDSAEAGARARSPPGAVDPRRARGSRDRPRSTSRSPASACDLRRGARCGEQFGAARAQPVPGRLTDFRNLLTSENALLQARNALVARRPSAPAPSSA